eukprot:350168-Hanusia_phi.AAC.1
MIEICNHVLLDLLIDFPSHSSSAEDEYSLNSACDMPRTSKRPIQSSRHTIAHSKMYDTMPRK